MARKGAGAGRGGGGSSSSGDGDGSVPSGRKALPSTEEDEGDAMAASIARAKKKKAKQRGGDSRKSVGARTHTKVKEKGAKKQKEAAAGTSGGRSGHGAQKEDEVARKKSKDRRGGKGETAARKGATGASSKKRNSGDGGGKRDRTYAPEGQHRVDLTSTGSGGGGVTGKPKAVKKRCLFHSSLVSPVSSDAEQQGPQKKKPRKEGQRSKSDAAGQQGPRKKNKFRKEEHQNKSQVLPGGGAGCSARGDVDRGNDSERKSETTVPATTAPKAPRTHGGKPWKQPRPAATTGANGAPAQAERKEIEWRIPKKAGNS